MRTKLCQRCGDTFTRSKRDRDVWCGKCENTVADATLYAVLFEDRTAIYGLFESWNEAAAVMREDASETGWSRLVMRRVQGQTGARSELVDRDDLADLSDQMWADREFERSV